MNNNGNVNWVSKLNDWDKKVLQAIGAFDGWILQSKSNPITDALYEDAKAFVDLIQNIDGYDWTRTGRKAICRLAVICQMNVYDHQNGVEGDGKPKGLRRHWYAYFKTRFAQPVAFQLRGAGDVEVLNDALARKVKRGEVDIMNVDRSELTMKDVNWNQNMSVAYADLVDNDGVTYRDLWVDDASRMISDRFDRLFTGANVVLCVEKDSLFEDFLAAARALGARAVYSGKGKSSKAAVEKMLREKFGWKDEYYEWEKPAFSYERPLYVLSISDHDFDGESVIAPTFAEQARRYTPYVYEARVGISPEHIAREDWDTSWYQVKTSNNTYKDWAREKGCFIAICSNCGNEWAVHTDAIHECPACMGESEPINLKDYTPYGFEVEALPTTAYARLIVDALLTIMPFDLIVEKLRDDCKADAWDAANDIKAEILANNESYQTLLSEFDRLETIKATFEQNIHDNFRSLAEPHVEDFRDEEEDPEPEDFRVYVESEGKNGYARPWRPFSRRLRTELLVEYIQDEFENEVEEATTLPINTAHEVDTYEPNEGERVLFLNPIERKWEIGERYEVGYYTFNTDDGEQISNVDFWMPLPSIPA